MTPAQIQRIIEQIDSGVLMLLPSGGIPGLSGSASSKTAISSLNQIKERSDTRGLVTLVANFAQAAKHWSTLPQKWQKALEHEWPAHLTIVYWQSSSSDLLTSFEGKIGLRVPKLQKQDRWLNEVLQVQPIASTSVNKSGNPAAIDWDDARYFCENNSITVPELPNQGSTNLEPSTVLEVLRDGNFKIHRQGGCSKEKIDSLINRAH